MQNCAEMERYLESEQLTPSSESKSSRSWTTFLSSVEQRPSSLALQSAAGAQSRVLPMPQQQQQHQHQPLLPVSFTVHRHCSTPSPTASSSSPFPLASPSSLGATTPDDDGSNPVDILCLLNIDGVISKPQSAGNSSGDVVSSSSSSSSSTTSWDSVRSEPDVPIPGPSTPFVPRAGDPVQQRYVRRPTELCLTPEADHRVAAWPSTCRAPGVNRPPLNRSNNSAASCFRRIAKRRRDVAASSPVARAAPSSVVRHPTSAPRATDVSVSATRTRWAPSHAPSHSIPRLPPLPSPAEMAYLRSLSGGVGNRTINAEEAKRASTDSVGGHGVQRDRSCPPPSLPLSPSPPENARLAAAVDASTTMTSDAATAGSSTDAKKQLRVYSCSVVDCGKLYSKSSHLKAHMRSHTGTTAVCRLLGN